MLIDKSIHEEKTTYNRLYPWKKGDVSTKSEILILCPVIRIDLNDKKVK